MATHHYVCSDFSAFSSLNASCSSDVLTFSGSGSEYISDDSGSFTMTNGTWYFSAVVTGSGTGRWLCGPTGSPACNTPSEHHFMTSQVDEPFIVDSGGAGTLYIRNDPAGGPFIGTLSAICISDLSTGCDAGGGGSTTTFATSATSTVPYGDWLLLNALILFCVAFIPVGTFYSMFTTKKK